MKKVKKNQKLKTSISSKIFDVANYLFFAVFAIACIYPIYYVLINSVSDGIMVLAGKVRFFPRGFNLTTYGKVLELPGIGRAVFVSISRTVLGTFASLLGAVIPGYIVSRRELWHKRFWYRFMVFTMYFGAGLIPGYLNLKSLGLLNTFWLYVIPSIVTPYNMILVKTYIESIPPSLEESAYIDGAGYFRRFSRIILPLSKPIIATIAVFSAVGQWNSYMDTFLYMTSSKYATLQSLLQQLMSQINAVTELMKNGNVDMAMKIAGNMNAKTIRFTMTAVTVIPILVVYPYFQKYFTKGIMIGAVKG